MAALSGEVSLALFSKLKASASKILAKEKVLREAAEKTAKNADEAEEIELFIWELRKILNETGDYSARFASKVSKNLDEVSSKIKLFESKIQKLDYEEGMLLNNAKKIEIKNVTQKLESSISWKHISDEKFVKSIITHNHPGGSALSLADVKMFIGTRLNEIRAVAPDGTVYSMKNKGISEKFSKELLKKIKTQEDFAKATLPNAPEYIDAFVFRLIWDDIKDLVDYNHYVN
ncbi:MAG: hypothetical protein ACOVLC_02940 [Flavobacterium sp.]